MLAQVYVVMRRHHPNELIEMEVMGEQVFVGWEVLGAVTPRRVARTSEYRVGKSSTRPKTNVCTRQSSISVF